MQASRSPIARCTRLAATAESTPPESPQIARRSGPTSVAIRCTSWSMKCPGVQSGAHPQIGNRKLWRISRPRGGCARIEDRVGPAREDDPLGIELPDEGEVRAARRGMDLAVYVRLPHPARDELRELRPVVEDEDAVHPIPFPVAPPWYHVVGSSTSPRSRSSRVSRWRAT